MLTSIKLYLFKRMKFEYQIGITYLVIGFFWIYSSDSILGLIIKDKELLTSLNILKGSAYVITTSLMLYYFVKRHTTKLHRMQERNKQRRKELELQNNRFALLNEELFRAKEQAEASDKLKTSFLQNISHEICTPMNSIIGFCEILEDPDLTPSDRQEYLSIIQNGTQQLLFIVTNILTISSIEAKQEKLNIRTICINQLLREQHVIFKRQASVQGISLEVNLLLSDIDATIYTDPTKLTQILTNLITNALKFTHYGKIEIGYTIDDRQLEFYVKDSGIGIPAEMQETIFKRFCHADEKIQKAYGGTGLGLSISKEFAEILGGNIRLESKPNKGSVFYLTIPYIKK